MSFKTLGRNALTNAFAVIFLLVACTPQNTAILTPTADVPDGGLAIADDNPLAADANVVGAEADANTLDATYTDNNAGFGFNYPTDWHIQNDPSFTAILTSYPADVNDEEIAEGETRISFVVLESDQQLEALIEAQRQEIVEAGGMVQDEMTIELMDGSARVLLQAMHNGDESIIAIVELADTNLLISGEGDLTFFNPILETLHQL